jgi:hypothetical protein
VSDGRRQSILLLRITTVEEMPIILKLMRHKKFDPSGNGPKEGLGLVCRWEGNNHFINMLSSFYII